MSQLVLAGAVRNNAWSAPLGRESGAWFPWSEGGGENYRTLLWRTFEVNSERAPLVFCMLNPSTATETEDDPTIRRCIGFAKRERAGGMIVVNLSPWRATDPRDLEKVQRAGVDVLLSDANRHAMQTARHYGRFVLAWGAHVRPWMDRAARTARCIAGDPLCLGKTKHGEPRHPLMLRADTPLVSYP
jgi:hypothetical protein